MRESESLAAAARNELRKMEEQLPGVAVPSARRADWRDTLRRTLLVCSALALPTLAFSQPAGGLAGVDRCGCLAARDVDPKLVLLIVADQLRAGTLKRYRPLLSGDGLVRLMRGATAVGHYGQQNTYTGPGHALIATGSYGYLNGITQNKWFGSGPRRT